LDATVEHREERDVKLNVGHVFCQKFNREVFGFSLVVIKNRVPASQAWFPQFRVIERFCVESRNKRSDRGALL